MDPFNPTIEEWWRTEHVEGVIHLYQDKGGRLMNTLRRRTARDSKELQFNLFSAVSTNKKGPGDKITAQTAAHSKEVLTPDTDFAGFWVERTDIMKMPEDEKDALNAAVAKAFARRGDDIIVTAAGLTSTTSLTGTGTGEFFSPDMSEQITEYFAENDVDEDEEIFNIVSPRVFRTMMRFKEFASSDYVGPDLPWGKQKDRGARTWNGQHWIRFNRLPKTGDIRTCFSWTRNAMAHAILGEMFFHPSWENQRNAWFLNHNVTQGAKILQDVGVLPIKIDESVDPIAIDPDTYEVAV